ncbi:MAG: glycosyltransferase family 2 protein [Anaerolineae bacterium]|nr:glycosyltransferase family 2 protein [Anaerolineae bacterium]
MEPRISIIIISWNVRELLDHCLLSLQAELARTPIQADVWIVDNASYDGSTAMVKKQHPWVQLEELGENLGYVQGNNYVLKKLINCNLPDYIWLLNPDTEIHPGALSTLCDFLDTHPQVGLIGPQLLNTDGTRQESAFRFPDLLQPMFDLHLLPQRFYYSRLNGRYPFTLYTHGSPFPIDFPLGAAMMARGEAIAQVGLLDERFFMYCEEIDWAWRMHKAGWQVWLVPAAKITHHSGASANQDRPTTTAYLWESRARLYRKHRGTLTRYLVRTLIRHRFKVLDKTSASSEWHRTYQKILAAWE